MLISGRRGREIGLFHARRQTERRRRAEERQSVVTLDDGQKGSIRRLLGSFQKGDLQPCGHHQSFVADYRRHLEANASGSGRSSDIAADVDTSFDEQLNARLIRNLESMKSSPEFARMLSFRKKLPAFERRDALVKKMPALLVVLILFCNLHHWLSSQ